VEWDYKVQKKLRAVAL